MAIVQANRKVIPEVIAWGQSRVTTKGMFPVKLMVTKKAMKRVMPQVRLAGMKRVWKLAWDTGIP